MQPDCLNSFSSRLRWYAVYTYPRHEKKVFESLQSRGFDSFLPTYQEMHRWRNGVKREIDLPLFPGYVFINVDVREKLRILQTPSVASIVGFGGEPAVLPDRDIETLRLALPKLRAEPHPFLRIGDRVRVKSGPLAGLEGILLQKKQGWRFILSMDLILQAVSVEVDCADVEPVLARVARVA